MKKRSSYKLFFREIMVGENDQKVMVKGALEYMMKEDGLMPKRVEPRNEISSLMVLGFFFI